MTAKKPTGRARRSRSSGKGVAAIVATIDRKLRSSLLVIDGDDIARDPFICCLKAAVSKCLDFNKSVHSKNEWRRESYLFVCGMRGICEDLIVLRYLSQVGTEQRTEFLAALMQKNMSDGVGAQSTFFRANNSFQPTVGDSLSEEEINSRVSAASDRLKAACKQMGLSRAPSVAMMARTVGLVATYNFIYFLTSNFVHFNPQALMRMGWGKLSEKNGKKVLSNVAFTTSNMAGYYRNLGKFYGTVLLVGYMHLLKDIPEIKSVDLAKEKAEIEMAISALDRWPEVVTFEEMNVRPPLFFLAKAFRKVMTDEGEMVGYGQILEELKLGAAVSSVAS